LIAPLRACFAHKKELLNFRETYPRSLINVYEETMFPRHVPVIGNIWPHHSYVILDIIKLTRNR
jgi:hypothetical protein